MTDTKYVVTLGEPREIPTKAFKDFAIGDVLVAEHTRIIGVKVGESHIRFSGHRGVDYGDAWGNICTYVRADTHYLVPRQVRIEVEL